MKIIIRRILLISFMISSAVMAADEAQLPPEPGFAAAEAARKAIIPRVGAAAVATLVIFPSEVIKMGAAITVLDLATEGGK